MYKKLNLILTYTIAAVWLINGLYCKLLALVPRHKQIVARILGDQHAALITGIIGVAEIIVAAWIISRISPRFNAIMQIILIAVMNILEFFLAPDLLLWGKANAFFAFLFIMLVYCNEFLLKRRRSTKIILC